MSRRSWRGLYKKQYGHDPSADMADAADDVEAWRVNWQAGYDAGEEWATSMVEGDE